ncbi:hypothetical protein [Cellulomonas hominis]|uniref:hypothetical protein n=1 Tax=Cellulomonas hominis TaxID=156981 RepID=UPI001BA0E821|nr:hypothetical protein [Cellulomonas hominis]VTR76155.1 hypothetical protein CHMI_00911 [Cellulomonas hominis]
MTTPSGPRGPARVPGPAPVELIDVLPATVPPSPLPVLLVRVVVAALIVLNLVGTWQSPAQRTVDELLVALDRGDVRTLTVESHPGGDMVGPFRVLWTGPGRPGTALLQVETAASSATDGTVAAGDPGTEEVVLDQRQEVLDAADASPGDVRVRFAESVGWTSWPHPYVMASAFLAALMLLITQPGPHLATRWAWFWLGAFAWPFWLAFVLLEPTPVWSRRPVTLPVRRLTGGWAWLGGVLLGNAVVAAVTGA